MIREDLLGILLRKLFSSLRGSTVRYLPWQSSITGVLWTVEISGFSYARMYAMGGETFEISEEIQNQMPDHIEPGSILSEIRHPWVTGLWFLIEEIGLENNQRLRQIFTDLVNDKHIDLN